jgi:hypothetical protein
MKKIKITLHSEPVQYHGGIVADVMANSIATSNYSQEETFLREVLQNSCDQRLEENKPIQFEISMKVLSGNNLVNLKKFLSHLDLKVDPLQLKRLLAQEHLEILVVADGNTKGLSGQLDASEEMQSNFAGFFYNVGRQEIESSSGGSFGLGRTVLTSASEYSTVLVYSRFFDGAKVKSRFMGMAICGSYAVNRKRYTGRHWFGKSVSSSSGEMSPFEGEEADIIARDLGLELLSETGMVAMVLGNKLISNIEEQEITTQDRKAAVEVLQQAAYKYAWPHMIGSKARRSVNFRFQYDDRVCPEKPLLDIPILSDYVRSYLALSKSDSPVKSKSILFRSSAINEETGTLNWLHIPDGFNSGENLVADIYPKNSIALIRQANFVVKYLEIPQIADGVSTRGIFKVNQTYDSLFRKSEPVAHDDWIPSKLQLKPSARNPIRQTLESIRQTFREISRPKTVGISGTASVQIGNSLGRLLGGLGLTGTDAPRTTSGGSRAVQTGSEFLQITPKENPVIIESNDNRYSAEFRFSVIKRVDSIEACKYEFSAHAILDNGMIENSPPEGASSPEIIAIFSDGGKIDSLTSILIGEGNCPTELIVTIQSPQGVASTCKIRKVNMNA